MKDFCKEVLEIHGISAKKIKKLNAGAASVIYLVQAKKLIVIKIKLKQGLGLENEFKILKLIESTKIVPKAIAQGHHKGRSYLIEEFLPGKRLPWRGMTLAQVKAAAHFFKKLHSTPLKPEFGLIKGKNLPLDRLNYARSSSEKYARLKPLVLAAEKKLENIPVTIEPVLRHTDPNPHNLIYFKGKIKAIDFEEAKVGHWAIDVADFIIKAQLNEKKKLIFLKTYACKNNLVVEAFIIVGWLSLCGWSIDHMDIAQKREIDSRLAIDVKRENKVLEKRIKLINKMLSENTLI